MILSVHATFGAAAASLMPTHPVGAFVVGFASHFLLDLIPHRDYELISVEKDSERKPLLVETIYRKFRLIRDITFVAIDALCGIGLGFMFFFDPVYPWIFLIGAVSSLIPDFFTFLYLIFRHKPFGLFYNFHSELIHSKMILNLSQIAGVGLQFVTVIILILAMFGIRSLF